MTLEDIIKEVDELDPWEGHPGEREAAIMLLTIITTEPSEFNGDKLSALTKIPRARIQDYLRRLRANKRIVGSTNNRKLALSDDALKDEQTLVVEFMMLCMCATGSVVTESFKPLAKQTPSPRVKVLDRSFPEKTQVELEPDPPSCGHTRPWLTCETCKAGQNMIGSTVEVADSGEGD